MLKLEVFPFFLTHFIPFQNYVSNFKIFAPIIMFMKPSFNNILVNHKVIFTFFTFFFHQNNGSIQFWKTKKVCPPKYHDRFIEGKIHLVVIFPFVNRTRIWRGPKEVLCVTLLATRHCASSYAFQLFSSLEYDSNSCQQIELPHFL